MDYLKFKQKLLNQEVPVVTKYTNNDLSYQISFMLKKARLVKGLTQSELAEAIGTKQESIARIENGKALPSLSFLTKIANAFNSNLIMPIFDFLAGDSDLDFYNTRSQFSTVSFNVPNGENLKPVRTLNNVSFERGIYHYAQ